MKKVYCRNCQYNGIMECKNPATPPIINPFTGMLEKRRWKDDFNEDGECPNYKAKKWYRFLGLLKMKII